MYKVDLAERYNNPAEFNRDNQLVLSRFSRLLFFAFVAYLVLPLVDIPLWGLSPSAIFIALVALEVFFGKHHINLQPFAMWFILIYFLWFGFLLSIVGNMIAGNIAVGTDDYIQIIRSTFWMVAFFSTIVILSKLPNQQLKFIIILLGVSVIVLGGIRVFEALAYQRWGGSTARILSQNNYGILFSRFAPFALVLPLLVTKNKRILSIVGLLILFIAIIANGSRSSWLSLSIGTFVFVFLVIITQPNRLGTTVSFIVVIFVLLISVISILPTDALEPIIERFETLESVEEDKSFMTRQLMIQKSSRAFQEHPLFGIGLGRFTRTEITLDRPSILQGSTTNFNQIASHNSYASLLAETGLFGVVPFSILIVFLVLLGLQSAIYLAKAGNIWSIAVYASFITMSIHQFTIDNLRNTSPWFVYGFMAAVIMRANWNAATKEGSR